MGWLKNILLGKPKVMPVSINDGNFRKEIFESELPVVLDVWGPGCPPCKRMEPIIVDLATRYQGQVKVAEMNAAASRRSASRLRVSGTPTVIYFKKGAEVERVVGFRGSLYHFETIEEILLDGGAKHADDDSA